VQFLLQPPAERHRELLPYDGMWRRRERHEHALDAPVGVPRGDVQESHRDQK
jgi:hypothetical protein